MTLLLRFGIAAAALSAALAVAICWHGAPPPIEPEPATDAGPAPRPCGAPGAVPADYRSEGPVSE